LSIEEEQRGNIAEESLWISSNMIMLAFALLRLFSWKSTLHISRGIERKENI